MQPDQLTVVRDEHGGACWQICTGGLCLQDRSGVRLLDRYRAVLRGRGVEVPEG